MDTIKKIVAKIEEKEICSVGIVMHDNPDSDAIGSAIALENVLKQLQKKVTIITQNKVNKTYSTILGKGRTNKINVPSTKFDVLFILDCSEPERINVDCNELGQYCIVIDHHIGFNQYGNIYWCEDVVATAILIYRLVLYMIESGINIKLNEIIATALYMAIRGDTFNFRNPGVTANTHFVVAELLEHGADLEKVNEIERYQRSLLRLQQDVWNNMMYDSVYKIMYVLVTKRQIEDNKSSYREASCIVDMMKLVKDVDIAILFLANGKDVYIKTRSNIDVNLAKVMEEVGGGGHKNAAGAHCYTDSSYSLMNAVVQKIKNEMDYEKNS